MLWDTIIFKPLNILVDKRLQSFYSPILDLNAYTSILTPMTVLITVLKSIKQISASRNRNLVSHFQYTPCCQPAQHLSIHNCHRRYERRSGHWVVYNVFFTLWNSYVPIKYIQTHKCLCLILVHNKLHLAI